MPRISGRSTRRCPTEHTVSKRDGIEMGVRAATRALLAGLGTAALMRVAYHFRRTLLLVALAAMSDLLLAADTRRGRRGLLGALRLGR